jgi:hypothetical protein
MAATRQRLRLCSRKQHLQQMMLAQQQLAVRRPAASSSRLQVQWAAAPGWITLLQPQMRTASNDELILAPWQLLLL